LELSAPPKPPLAFRVGVVGHRPNRLQHADMAKLAEVLRSLLEAVQAAVLEVASKNSELFSPVTPVFTSISPLAEGIDRIFAEQALDLGWRLCCVTPFPQEEFERDFAPDKALETDSLARFHRILDCASARGHLTRLQLDGKRNDESAAYANGGTVVFSLSDILIVVWDGERLGKRGGTEDTLNQAGIAGIPVVVVDAKAPHRWRLNIPGIHANSEWFPYGTGLGDLEAVRQAVRDSLAFPDPMQPVPGMRSTKRMYSIEQYYKERHPRWSVCVLWKAFRDVVGDGRWPAVTFSVAPFEESVLGEWPRDESTSYAIFLNHLRPYYAWTDKLAVWYSDRYRSSSILCFGLGAWAVCMALWTPTFGYLFTEKEGSFLELLSIIVGVAIYSMARLGLWHERWLDCRLGAELVRHLRIVAPTCGKRPFPQIPAHYLKYGQPAASWMNWYVRAITRATGMRDTVLDHIYLKKHLDQLRGFLEGQVGFHAASHRRAETIESRLATLIKVLAAMTFAACVCHIIGYHVFHIPGGGLAFICAVFPAIAGALAAINNHGEFRRVEKRSAAMKASIEMLIQRIDNICIQMEKPDAETISFFQDARNVSSDAADLLVREVLDWRVLFQDRPQEMGA